MRKIVNLETVNLQKQSKNKKKVLLTQLTHLTQSYQLYFPFANKF